MDFVAVPVEVTVEADSQDEAESVIVNALLADARVKLVYSRASRLILDNE